MKVLALINGTVERTASGAYTISQRPFPQGLPTTDSDEPYFGPEPVYDTNLNALRLPDMPGSSPAAKAGLKSGDVVVEFGEIPISTIKEFRTVMESFSSRDMPAMSVRRQGRPMRLAVALEDRGD